MEVLWIFGLQDQEIGSLIHKSRTLNSNSDIREYDKIILERHFVVVVVIVLLFLSKMFIIQK